ncbi:LuxR C-terminal-related transcriptional regulator [Tsuneonella sp. SYSU-LHT278]|uniref:LuxR C-terminal-related transcriptional regulator n=1 Tax=Tsuneonella sediminis TaxID=3416089 RepID=UPI003F7A28BB
MDTADNISRAKALVDSLSHAELAFLRRLAEGHSRNAIADSLDLSTDEATGLRSSMMRKLGASVTADAVRIAIYARL